MSKSFAAILLSAAALYAPAAAAQPPMNGAGADRGPAWSASVGGGLRFAPSYVGDDNYQLFLLPNIRASYGDRLTLSVPEGVKYDVIKSGGLRIGPNVRPAFGRNEDGRQPFSIAGDTNTDLLGLGDINTAVEVGGYVSYKTGKTTIGATVAKALGGHDGVVADVSLRYADRAMLGKKPLFYSLGPSVRVVDQTFHQSYFGVTATQSIASGLDVYRPDGGLNSYGFSATATYPLRKRVAVTAIAGYDRLTEEAGQSSLVRERGARDQANLGLFFSYRFGGR
ncbi:MAG: MipA/OmpV family protein [Pseudomonadota bacterium]